MNEMLKKFIPKKISPKILITVGLLGIVLIGASSLLETKEKPEVVAESEEMSVLSYKQLLEEELCQMVTYITGSRKVSVVVTLDSSVVYSYADITKEATSDKTEGDTKSAQSELDSGYVTIKTADGGEEALLIKAEMPSVRGVAVVCEGGDNERTAEKIKNAVMAALDITAKRVYICGRK